MKVKKLEDAQVLVNGYMKDANYKTVKEVTEIIRTARKEVGHTFKGEDLFQLEICSTYYRHVDNVQHLLEPREDDRYTKAGYFMSLVVSNDASDEQIKKMMELGIHPSTDEHESCYFDICNSAGMRCTKLIRSLDTVVSTAWKMGLNHFVVRPF